MSTCKCSSVVMKVLFLLLLRNDPVHSSIFFVHVAFHYNHNSLLHIESVVYNVIGLSQVLALMVMAWQLISNVGYRNHKGVKLFSVLVSKIIPELMLSFNKNGACKNERI